MNEYIVVTHAAATWFMAGLVWFVQVVHYPLMTRVGQAERADYAVAHQQRTTLVVAPAMLLEALCAGLLVTPVVAHPSSTAVLLAWVGVALLVAIWALTFAVLVPLHGRLARGDAHAVGRLVQWNLARTALWSARGVVAISLCTGM